jgi:GWxTD domain-containing protein
MIMVTTSLRRAAVAALLTLCAAGAYAAGLNQMHEQWGKGPVTWIMTREESREWKQIKNDEDAEKFIQLFWARRDPTPGTYANEYKAEFDSRVQYADEHYGNRRMKGSMTERGRAGVILGYPPLASQDLKQQSKMMAGDQVSGGSSGHQLGARDIWLWEGKEPQERFGMPRVEIVFLEDPHTGEYTRDTQRGDFIGAMSYALKKMMVSPDLKEVPDWAKPQLVFAPVEKAGKSASKALRQGEPGVHRLLLVKDIMSVPSAQEGGDPFAGRASSDTFSRTDDLGYAFEYCGAAETLKMTIAITGLVGGKKVNMVTPTDDVTPDPIRAVPGCSMIRASIPLSDLSVQPGTYSFGIKLQDGGQSYNLAQDFKVE